MPGSSIVRHTPVIFNVFSTWPVALFARNSEYRWLFPEAIQWDTGLFDPRTMAFKAACEYGSGKVCNTINITRAVDPLAKFRKVTHRKLIKALILPVEKRLPVLCRSCHQADFFLVFKLHASTLHHH
jgi:hypothetical protein